MNREPMHDDFDDLDHAIFGLELATPPPGLRESILRATIYAPPASAPAFAMREIVFIGATFAVIVWLTLYAAANHAFGPSLATDALALVRALGETTTLSWLAAGGVVALCTQLVQVTPLRLPVRPHRP